MNELKQKNVHILCCHCACAKYFFHFFFTFLYWDILGVDIWEVLIKSLDNFPRYEHWTLYNLAVKYVPSLDCHNSVLPVRKKNSHMDNRLLDVYFTIPFKNWIYVKNCRKNGWPRNACTAQRNQTLYRKWRHYPDF